MRDKTGGPAFPELYISSPEPDDYRTMSEGGMTLRDYFAGKAMSSLIAEEDENIRAWLDDFGEGLVSSKALAKTAYELADAMIKERDQ